MSLVYLPEETWSLRYGSDYFTVAIVKSVVKEDEFALYELEIQNGRRIWKVLRRFSEFDRLQANVRFIAGNRLPKLPPKTFCCRDLNPDFLARRKELLQDFLHQMLQIPGVANDDRVRKFLGLKLSTELYV
uniref:PX domain-containing protein n=1 Tax=Peronospora matthiolae TaxID=2874970 RepID=A0AAV1TXI3_9STRA